MAKYIAAVLIILSASVSAAETITGKVVGIADGDTLTLLDVTNTQHKIRLGQIDAPEVGHGADKPTQPFGERSRQSLADLVHGRQITADCDGRSYERLVCQVKMPGLDVNLEQVRRGMAWAYPKYVREQRYYEAQEAARAGRIGLWTDPRPVPPWEWRHR